MNAFSIASKETGEETFCQPGVDDNPTHLAADIVDNVISSPAYKEAWSSHYDSKIYSNHIVGAKQHLEGFKQNTLNDKEKALVIAFMRDVLKALQKASKQSYQPLIDAIIEDLETTTGRRAPSRLLMKNHKYRQMLEALEHDLMHDVFTPEKDIAKVGIHLYEELVEILSSVKKTASFGVFTALTVKVGLFMHANIGINTPTDPTVVGLTPSDLDDQGNVRSDFTAFDISNSQLSCHDHMKALVGEDAAIFIQDRYNGFVIEHCPQFMTFTSDAQSFLNGTYDWYKSSVFDKFVTDVAQTFGFAISSADSLFRTGFEEGLEAGSPALYGANIVENAVLHPLVTCGTAAIILHSYFSRKDHTVLHDVENAVVDYIKRSYKTRPLKYIFGASAGAGAYAINSEFGPVMFLSAFGGMVLGHYVQRSFNAKARMQRARQMANGTFLNFHQQPYKESHIASYLKYGIPFTLLATAITAASIDPEFSRVFGEYVAYGLLGGFFIPFNGVEDSGQHIIFGAGGVIIAAAAIAAHFASKSSIYLTPETRATYDYVSLYVSYYKGRSLQEAKKAFSALPDMPGKHTLKAAWQKLFKKKHQPSTHRFEYDIYSPTG